MKKFALVFILCIPLLASAQVVDTIEVGSSVHFQGDWFQIGEEIELLKGMITSLGLSLDSISSENQGGAGGMLPVGHILAFAGSEPPDHYLLCYGQEVLIEQYPALYDLINTTFGAGDSAFWAESNLPPTTFNLPDLRGRTLVGTGDMGGEASDVVTQHHVGQGQTGGEEFHLLLLEEIPSHSHGYNGGLIGSDGTGNNGFVQSGAQAKQTSLVGGGQPHNNMQPYMGINFIIRVE